MFKKYYFILGLFLCFLSANTASASMETIGTNKEEAIVAESIDDTAEEAAEEATEEIESFSTQPEIGLMLAAYSEAAQQDIITVDEVMNAAELAKEKAKASYSKKDLRLLSALIYSEAGNQSYKGMLAVGNVVLNRVESPEFVHVTNIKEVIYDKKWAVQFSVTVKSSRTGTSALDKALALYDNGDFSSDRLTPEETNMKRCIKAAKAALEGDNNINDLTHFRTTSKSIEKKVAKKHSDYVIIGSHIFY